jgi:hypothetical protein
VILGVAYSLPCLGQGLLPWLYPIYLALLLVCEERRGEAEGEKRGRGRGRGRERGERGRERKERGTKNEKERTRRERDRGNQKTEASITKEEGAEERKRLMRLCLRFIAKPVTSTSALRSTGSSGRSTPHMFPTESFPGCTKFMCSQWNEGSLAPFAKFLPPVFLVARSRLTLVIQIYLLGFVP